MQHAVPRELAGQLVLPKTSKAEAIRERLQAFQAAASSALAHHAGLTGRLTLLLMALYGTSHWELRVPTIMWASIGLAFPRCVHSAAFWLVLAVPVLGRTLMNAYVVDNHKLLLAYWVVALAVAGADRKLVAHHARVLIGLCFAWAMLWKLYNVSFTSGEFLAWEMLSDGRFEAFTSLVPGLGAAEQMANHQALSLMHAGGGSVELCVPDSLRWTSYGMTAWTLLIEGSIAVGFLFSTRSRRLRSVRNYALLAFLGSTYAIATVIGFGWLLAVMGYAQCEDDERGAALGYLGVFVGMQIFMLPWRTFISSAAVL